eukprot:snap_masked-scaffold_19-processed-gene-2.8-mRNA-1 protein AED:1.00 eAED:1.00 QI:0/0/0/0/1/1/2/0/78
MISSHTAKRIVNIDLPRYTGCALTSICAATISPIANTTFTATSGVTPLLYLISELFSSFLFSGKSDLGFDGLNRTENE